MQPDQSKREALAEQAMVSHATWAGLTDDICGIEVLQFAPIHFSRLSAVGSPFVCGGREPVTVDCENLLWCVSPFYHPSSRWKKFRFWRSYYRATRKLKDFSELVDGIDAYLDEAMENFPPMKAGAGRGAANCSPAVSYMCALCETYTMTPELVLRTPYKQLFQLYMPIAKKFGSVKTPPRALTRKQKSDLERRHD